jgi:long-chain acyl-CoA synthetase
MASQEITTQLEISPTTPKGRRLVKARARPLCDLISRSDRIALRKGDDSWTYRRLLTEADRLAAGLAATGLSAGSRVALHLDNGPEIAITYLACFRLGAVIAPLNLRFKRPELEEMLRRLRPHLYIGDTQHYRLIQPIDTDLLSESSRFVVGDLEDVFAQRWASLLRDETAAFDNPDVDAPAALFSTSGTTGKPKLVVHSQATLGSAAARIAESYLRPDDVISFSMPMVHTAGAGHFLASLLTHASLIMLNATDPGRVLDNVETERCTYLTTFPAVYARLIDEQRRCPRDVSSLRVCLAGGDICPPGQREAFQLLFGRPLVNVWSAAEATGSYIELGPAGRPVTKLEVRLVDTHNITVLAGEPGELLLRGPNIALGYWIGPGEFDSFADGWYRSGDIMRQDKDGSFWYVARVKDLIVRAGSNISPVEVEQVLVSHPAVQDAGVVGVPAPGLGQCVIGFVQLVEGAGRDQLEHIRHYVLSQLADYKIPERLIPVSAIPRNALGKVERTVLARMAVT